MKGKMFKYSLFCKYNQRSCKRVKLILFTTFYLGQGPLEEYQKSNEMEPIFSIKISNSPGKFQWIGESQFWYVNNNKNDNMYLLVNPVDKRQNGAFDHVRLATSLSGLLDEHISERDMKNSNGK